MERRRGWLGWLADNPLISAGLALALIIAIVGIVVAVNRSGDETIAVGSSPAPGQSVPGVVTTGTPAPGTSPGALPTGTASVPSGTTTGGTTKGTTGTTPVKPVTAGCKPVQPKAANGQPETGITGKEITVGQIVTDAAGLPAQLKPNYEGLSAYFKGVNDAGGVCGRKITIAYRNDQLDPSTHDQQYSELVSRVFAFVANSSLFDSRDYQPQTPFNPRLRDERTNEYVPDVGGLAYGYNRGQSAMHAGTVGSISPVLTGGGAYRGMLDLAKAQGRTCRRMGIVYLIEPTFASRDQARLGQRALEESWGGNLGAGNAPLYEASLNQPEQVYRGIVERMIRDGVNCVGTFADLGSNVSLVQALANVQAWPPGKCARSNKAECFAMVYMPFSGYDPKFIRDVEAANPGASKYVYTFLPHLPLGETGDPALKAYIDSLARCKKSNVAGCKDAEPSSFGIIGYASGRMFVDALKACGAAPTRTCVMTHVRNLKDFTAGGLLGRITPFKTTRANDNVSGGCNAQPCGVWNWKWIFTDTITVQILGNEKDLIKRFHRVRPTGGGYAPDTLKVARGEPA